MTKHSLLRALCPLFLVLTLASCSFFVDNDGIASLRISAGQNDSSGSARTVSPSSDLDIASYRLSGAVAGGNKDILALFDSLDSTSKVNVAAGSWDFTLEALDSSGVAVLSGSLSAQTVSAGPNELYFTLTPLAAGAGTIKLSVSWPESIAVASALPTVTPLINDTAESVASVSATGYTFEKVAARGGYRVTLSLRNASGTEIASVSEWVVVYPNLISSATIALAAADFNAAPVSPTALTAVTISNLSDAASSSVSLSWTDTPTTETGFEAEVSVYDSVSDAWGDWSACGTTAAAVTTLSTTQARGAICRYRLRATNSFGASAWVESASFTAPWLVSFDTDGGSTIAARELAAGSLIAQPADPTKSGAHFLAWYSTVDKDVAWNFASDTVATNQTLYAAWDQKIIFDANGGTGSMAELSPTGSVTLTANTFTRANYTFKGWSTTALGKVEYADGATYSGISGATLYARWCRSDATPVANFTYTAGTDSVTLNTYTGGVTYTSIVIPDLIDGKPVVGMSLATMFAAAKSVLVSMYFPESFTAIPDSAFASYTKLKTVTIGQAIATIGTSAFTSCSAMTSLTILGPASIGQSAFYYCSALTTINFPAVTSVAASAFYYCSGLTSVTLPAATSIGDSAFSSCSAITSVSLPEAKTIGGGVFNSAVLASVTMPKVETIGSSAFSGSAITELDLPLATTIGVNAFYSCTKLTTIKLPLVTSVSSGAFQSCTKLTAVDLPIATSVGSTAFASCSKITQALLPVATTIGDSAFSGCASLETVSMPAAKTLGDSAFASCAKLADFAWPTGLTSIGNTAFSGCKKITTVTIPYGVTALGSSAFNGCVALTTVSLPVTVTSLGASCFSGCTSLEGISLPSKLTSIGGNCFYNCSALSSIVVPDTVTSIGSAAFFNCQQLKTATLGQALLSIGQQAFGNCYSLTSIVVPDSVAITEYSTYSYLFQNCVSLETAKLGAGITAVPNYTFDGCSALKSVTLGSGVTGIGTNAFQNCLRLQTVDLPVPCADVNIYAFSGCSALESVTGCLGLKTVGQYAFNKCDTLVSINLPAATSIADYAFQYCRLLTKARLGEKLTSIGTLSFANCYALASVTLDATVPPTVANVNAFYGNASGRTFYVPNWADDSVVNTYKANASWTSFAGSIVEQP